MLWAHHGMRCALVLTSFTALEGLFRITGLESAGFDRFRHLFIRQQTWQISRMSRSFAKRSTGMNAIVHSEWQAGKRRRALVETHPPRNTRLRLIATVRKP